MEILRILVEILIAFFAVIGAYCLWRLVADRLFGSDRMLLAIEILTEEDAKQAEWLVREAMTHILWLRSGQIFILTTEVFANDERLLTVMRTYGVTCKILTEARQE